MVLLGFEPGDLAHVRTLDYTNYKTDNELRLNYDVQEWSK